MRTAKVMVSPRLRRTCGCWMLTLAVTFASPAGPWAIGPIWMSPPAISANAAATRSSVTASSKNRRPNSS